MRLYDAHNHLQDDRLAPFRDDIASRTGGIAMMVVNGCRESDWGAVLELARRMPNVIPSFGCHPWYVRERSTTWKAALHRHLDAVPSAVGEIGLDRWIEGHDVAAQVEGFRAQMEIAAERNVPASIHCLKAWGLLESHLRHGPRPACGFLLHSYGGPIELIEPLATMGAYFSLPGAFAHARKLRQREAFRLVPPDRLLIETDAPDQALPDERDAFQLAEGATGRRLNHPANLEAVYWFAAEVLDRPITELADQVEANFLRLFGGVRSARPV